MFISINIWSMVIALQYIINRVIIYLSFFYLGIYDFLEITEPVIIKFDDFIAGYTDEDINK